MQGWLSLRREWTVEFLHYGIVPILLADGRHRLGVVNEECIERLDDIERPELLVL